MQLRKHNSRRITHFQIYDRNYGQETSRQTIERKETRDQESNRNDQKEHIRKEKQEKHKTGSNNIKPRKRNQRRTNTENGQIQHTTGK